LITGTKRRQGASNKGGKGFDYEGVFAGNTCPAFRQGITDKYIGYEKTPIPQTKKNPPDLGGFL
jgi:hypothetical protein